jgi:hypothetical protein
MARRHHVLPLLAHGLGATCREVVPADALERLRADAAEVARRSDVLTAALLRVVTLLEGEGIRALAYRGAILTATAYGGRALRQFSDVDVLVHERDYAAAARLLRADGYVQHFDGGWEAHFRDAAGTKVDLHRRVFPQWLPLLGSFDALWERHERVVIGGTPVPTLSAADVPLMLSGHVAKDACENHLFLSKVCDIAEFVRAHEALDWDAVARQAARHGGERMLLLGLRLAHGLLDATLPPPAAARARKHPTLDTLAATIAAQLEERAVRATLARSDLRTALRTHVAMRERRRDRARVRLSPYRARFRQLVTPNERDRTLLRLPPSLVPLYYLLRPLRLAWTYGIRPLTRR